MKRWGRQETNFITSEQEQVFLHMKRRLLQREWNGRRERRNNKDLIALLILLVILYGAGAASYNIRGDYTITLNLAQMTAIGMWILGVTFITYTLGKTKFISVLYWILVYWPLCAAFASVATSPFFPSESKLKYYIIFYALSGVDVLTIAVFLVKTYFYPFFIDTKYFRETLGAGKFWGIRVVSDWAMTYEGSITKCKKRYACKYEGELNENGLPHGTGQWIDDSYWGELLSGVWENGKPVAPYVSRQYGTGDTFCAVPIAYFMASDDEFDSSDVYPSDKKDPRCGVASVECSIQGAFYNNLPDASKLYGPFIFGNGENQSTMAECIRRLAPLKATIDDQNRVTVISSDPRGVQVHGHIHEQSGLPFYQDTNDIVINLERKPNIYDNAEMFGTKIIHSNRNGSIRNSLPFASSGVFHNEFIHVLIEDEEKDDDPTIERNISLEEKLLPQTDPYSHYQPLSLRVQNWKKDTHKAALVYFPGFASPLKKSLESLGQFMALTKLSQNVHAIVYEWPTGSKFSYKRSSKACSSDRCKEHFRNFLKGLQDSGIRYIHLMSHSMGVQALLSMFDDDLDGSRSEASLFFQLDHSYATTNDSASREEADSKMICKSVTLLNPDFPVDAFLDHAFIGVRRICNHVTIVGDQNDQALLLSEALSAVLNYFGLKQSDLLSKRDRDEKVRFYAEKTVGRNFDSLFFPNNDNGYERQIYLFRETPSLVLSPLEEMQDQQWIDIDVIDSSNIDTNVASLRHSAFNVNPIILKDLEELILTGRRATSRSTLIHREGNIFSYAHAPSFMSL